MTGHRAHPFPLHATSTPCIAPLLSGQMPQAPLPAHGPPSTQVAMLGTSSAPWAPLAQVPRGTLIFNFLSEPLAGESSTWHGGTADARCDGGQETGCPGHAGFRWGTQPSAVSHSCAALCLKQAGEQQQQMCACLQERRGERQLCCPDGEDPPGPLAARAG